MNINYDYLFKVIVLGDCRVGKSTLCALGTNNSFNTNTYIETIALDFISHRQKIDDESIKIHFWDTTGNPLYSNIINSYYKDMAGIFFVFDVTNRVSFKNIQYYYKSVLDKTQGKRIKFFLIGNKSDEQNREVTAYEGDKLATQLKATYKETNKNDFSMPSVIEECVREMYVNINRLDNIVNRKNITSHIPLHTEEDDSIKNKLMCCSIL
jgi:small GTP-binding protein